MRLMRINDPYFLSEQVGSLKRNLETLTLTLTRNLEKSARKVLLSEREHWMLRRTNLHK